MPSRHRKHHGNKFTHCFVAALMVSLTALPVRSQAPLPDPKIELPKDPAAVLAVVGRSRILMGDISAKVDAKLKMALKGMKQQIPEAELKMAKIGLTRQALVQAIHNKMMKESFLLDQVGTQTAEKRLEASQMMEQRARQMFFENEVKKLKEIHKTEDLTELDKILREKGSSLSARQRDFTDAMLGHMFMRSKVNQDPNVTIAEIVQYYLGNQDEFSHKAQARWEQLSALFKNHPTTEEADVAIKEMGREAYFGGNLQAIAKQKSEEPFASDGGVHQWTNQGALASKEIDLQIFSIPLNKMSEIIKDDSGFHIVRVLDRKPAGVTPLAEVQEKIREKLKKGKIAEAQQGMLDQMRNKVPVWSRFPDDVKGARPLPDYLLGKAGNGEPKVLK